jgi:hypothetical protein
MGGRHVAVRKGNRLTDAAIRAIAARQLPDPRDLMVHCAQEMNHLVGFLPAQYDRCCDESSNSLAFREKA